MCHPHEFATAAYNLATLQSLVDTLLGQGWSSINFHTVIVETLLGSPNNVTVMPSMMPASITNTTISIPSARPSYSYSPSLSLSPTIRPANIHNNTIITVTNSASSPSSDGAAAAAAVVFFILFFFT